MYTSKRHLESTQKILTKNYQALQYYTFSSVDDIKPISDGKVNQLIHRIAAKLLFVSKRGRPDIQVAVPFLTTRVTKPNKNKGIEQELNTYTVLIDSYVGTPWMRVSSGYSKKGSR